MSDKHTQSPMLRAMHRFALSILYDVAHFDDFDTTESEWLSTVRDELDRIASGETLKREDAVDRICSAADMQDLREYSRISKAAPELLTSLKRMEQFGDIARDFAEGEVEVDGEMVSTYDLLAEARAAIAKAEGRAQ